MIRIADSPLWQLANNHSYEATFAKKGNLNRKIIQYFQEIDLMFVCSFFASILKRKKNIKLGMAVKYL